MRKISLIVLVMLLLSGCGIFRKRSGDAGGSYAAGELSVDGVIGTNLTGSDFFVPKAEVDFRSEEFQQDFTASIKFKMPDEYLVSVRWAGIEAARVYFNSDTVLVNDRISRTLYYGKPADLELKYGINPSIMALILGDYIGSKSDSGKHKCQNGVTLFEENAKGKRFIYTIDCRKRKLVMAEQDRGILGNRTLEYSGFTEIGGASAPTRIRIKADNPQSTIDIKINDIVKPWNGTLEFIPGNRYKKQRLR